MVGGARRGSGREGVVCPREGRRTGECRRDGSDPVPGDGGDKGIASDVVSEGGRVKGLDGRVGAVSEDG